MSTLRTTGRAFALGSGALIAAIALAAGAEGIGKSAPTAADELVLPTDAKVGDESFGTLTARWWQWAEDLPIAPYLDPDGRWCDLGQEGPVWFLAGTDGTFNAHRECVVPADRHILVPVINMRHSNSSDLPLPCSVLQSGAAVNNRHLASAVVLIDGVPVTNVAQYRVASPECFPLSADDEDSPQTAADGYWLLLKPLPPGRHTLVIGANYAAEESAYGKMLQNFEYVLHVGGATRLALR